MEKSYLVKLFEALILRRPVAEIPPLSWRKTLGFTLISSALVVVLALAVKPAQGAAPNPMLLTGLLILSLLANATGNYIILAAKGLRARFTQLWVMSQAFGVVILALYVAGDYLLHDYPEVMTLFLVIYTLLVLWLVLSYYASALSISLWRSVLVCLMLYVVVMVLYSAGFLVAAFAFPQLPGYFVSIQGTD